MNEKLLRFALVLTGIGTLLGFAWKMYDYGTNPAANVAPFNVAAFRGTFGSDAAPKLGTHLLAYAEYKVLQDLNITGYVAPPPVVENAADAAPKAIFSAEDIEVPLIQSPNAAWVQGRGETAGEGKFTGDFRVIGEVFELPNKAGLKLRLKSVQPGWVEIEAVESGKIVKVHAVTFEVDASHVFAGTDAPKGAVVAGGEGATFVNPVATREIEPYSYAVGTDDLDTIEQMSEEEILSSLPHRVHRDPLSNEIDGLRILSVPKNSVFERLGLRADDIVLEVNGQPATNRDQLLESMRKLDTDVLKVRIERLGGVRTLTFRLPR